MDGESNFSGAAGVLDVINSVANPAEGVGSFTLHEELGIGDKIAEGAIPVVLQALLILSDHEPQCGINCTGERY